MVCIYKPESGEFEEKDRSEISDIKETWRGFYKDTDKGLVGVFATDQGPVFFVNDSTYLLTEGDWDFIIEEMGDKNAFTFYYNGQEQFKIEYIKTKDLGIHPYADEEFMDFFVWMSKKKESKSFIDFYILKA